MKKPTPTQTESPFGFNEFFFSTTDPRGVITFGNDVFIRISGYPHEVMDGAPHSIIRHPDMPRAVFKLLWDTIQTGAPIVAYVKNMSASGNFYWVMAFVFPIENGYLSIRVKPSSPLFNAAQAIYAQALEVEEKEGMEGSIPFILTQIKNAGFQDYKDFMIRAALAELSILHEKNKPQNDAISANSSNTAAQISNMCHEAAEDLKDCFERVQNFQKINESFTEKMEVLNLGFQHLKFIALNMTVAAAKFGEMASSLGVVAKEFSELSGQIRGHLSGLSDFVTILSQVVQNCALRIVALDTQMIMVDFFVGESLQKITVSEDAFADMNRNKTHFSRLFREYTASLSQEIVTLHEHIKAIHDKMGDVRKFTTGLEVIRQIGAVESSRLNETKQTFQHYLDEMHKFISLLQTSSTSIQRELNELQANSEVINTEAAKLGGLVDSIFTLAANYSTNTAKNTNSPLI